MANRSETRRSLRRVMAVDLEPGVSVAVRCPNGAMRAFSVTRVRTIRNGSVFVWGRVLHTPGIEYEHESYVRIDGHIRVCVLPRHYGVCFDCGALSPCPDELTERRSERAMAEVDPFELIFDDIVAHAAG
ncbi:hypothetical protein [Mycolicibacterium fortuitum]